MRGANALYEGHRLMLPGIKDRAAATCQGCRFFVPILGQEETRPACLATLDLYLTGEKRIPKELKAIDFILKAGKEILIKAVQKAKEERGACGYYCPKY